MALVERGTLALGTTARSLLGDDLPLVADDVTVEHLLAHRSGIGDYFDEEAVTDITDYVMPVPVHELATTEQYLPVLDGHETRFPAGERFSYNNGGYVVLALLAERASGVGFHELVRTLVCEPAGMVDTAFLRSDELPGRAALGYLAADGLRTNVLHLPVRRQRGRWRLLDGGRPAAPSGTRCSPDGSSRRRRSPTMLATAQRLARGAQPVRPRLPPARDHRHGLAGGVRRRRVVRQRAPPLVGDHVHGHLQLDGRRLAGRAGDQRRRLVRSTAPG